MPELIDRANLLEHLAAIKPIKPDEYVSAYGETVVKVIGLIEEFVKEMPTIEPKRGEWVETEPDEDDRKIGIEFSIKCSRCHDENFHLDFNENHEITGKTFWKSRFCPNCGAYMRGVSEDAGSKTD